MEWKIQRGFRQIKLLVVDDHDVRRCEIEVMFHYGCEVVWDDSFEVQLYVNIIISPIETSRGIYDC